MAQKSTLAIIGSGPTGIYCLQHILENSQALTKKFTSILIFEKEYKMGYGMPYNPSTTDFYHLANISSEEIPKLPQTFAQWLKSKNKNYLKNLNVKNFPIDKSEVYSRLALGEYFHSQYISLVELLRNEGFEITEICNCPVNDIQICENTGEIICRNSTFIANKILIATGHNWKQKDVPKSGYYDSPWPISKIIPKKKSFYNYEIGILGASLSAFDVVTSLAHRHGKFVEVDGKLRFQSFEGAENFKLTLHDTKGLLPHLQYEQVNPFRKIYRHVSRKDVFKIKAESTKSFLQPYFNQLCKPILYNALEKDNLNSIAIYRTYD
jgi:uncharacterized NAD(P)/FAD-binding protein YdhS